MFEIVGDGYYLFVICLCYVVCLLIDFFVMKFVILFCNSFLYFICWLVEVVCVCGYIVCIFDLLCCYMCIVVDGFFMYYKGWLMIGVDMVILCIGVFIICYGIVVLCQFELMGVCMFNLFDVILCLCDKLCVYQLLVVKGIDMLVIVFGDNFDDIVDLLFMFGLLFYVVKFNEGIQGCGVILIEKVSVLCGIVEVLCGLYVNFLMQEFIGEVKGVDLCCFVVGDQVVVLMQWQVLEGDFCFNLYVGGIVVVVKVSCVEQQVVVCLVKVLGLLVCGVDLICFVCGLLVLEVNFMFGLEGIEVVCGVDVVICIIEYVEKIKKF